MTRQLILPLSLSLRLAPVAITYVSLSNYITPLCFAVLSELKRRVMKVFNVYASKGVPKVARSQNTLAPRSELLLPPALNRAKAQHACVLRPPERGGAGCQSLIKTPMTGTPSSTWAEVPYA